MPVEYHTGDLFLSGADAFAHGCNCIGVMGAGIAVRFRSRYPEMFEEYVSRCKNGLFKVGSIYAYSAPSDETIYNLGTQPYPGACAKLEFIETCLEAMLNHATVSKPNIRTIALPRIGCGFGGLNWLDVKQIVENAGNTTKINLLVYSL